MLQVLEEEEEERRYKI